MKIEKGRSTYEGVVEDKDGNIVCEKCGGTEGKMVSHMDGTDWYSTTIQCKCGNVIYKETERTEEEKMYWMEEEESEVRNED